MEWDNTIYVGGLPQEACRADKLNAFFSQIGIIKKSKKRNTLNEPTIHIYMDKARRQPKGDATISFVDPETAKAAVECFNNKEYEKSGKVIQVSIATRPAAGNWRAGGGKGGGGKGGGKGRPY